MLDLFAGTGALGLEAISRGAAQALFVETGVEGRGTDPHEHRGARTDRRHAHPPPRRDRRSARPARSSRSISSSSTPLWQGLGEKALLSAAEGGWLKPGALLVLEERAGANVKSPAGFAVLDRREGGESQLLLFRFSQDAA